MGRLKGGASNDDAEKLTLAEINKLIAHAEWRFNGFGSPSQSASRKSAFKRLVWLEEQRERVHDVPAPARRPLRARDVASRK